MTQTQKGRDVAAFLDGVAVALDRALAAAAPDMSTARAAHAAGVEAQALRRFLGRDRQSCQLSTLLHICLAHEIPVAISIGGRTVQRG